MLPESEYVANPVAWQGFGKSPAPVFGWDNSVTEGVLLCFMALLHGRDKARRSESLGTAGTGPPVFKGQSPHSLAV